MRSLSELESIASRIRRTAGIEFVRTFDVVDFIETGLATTFPGLRLVRVSDDQLPHADAEANSSTNTILVKESIYQRAKDWNPRARFILVEEVCHIALGHKGPRYRRSASNARIYSNSERQDESEARQLAALILAPTSLAKNSRSIDELAEQFQISHEAARYRWSELEAYRRRASGKKRELPQGIIDFLKEQRRRGHKVTALDDD